MPFRRILTLALLTLSAASSLAQSKVPAAGNTVALTPPMGWNSWNHFARNVSDATIRATADVMVSSGMRDAGYIYVNIDDTWEGQRDAQGNIQSNSKFPDMKALSDYVHSKGLKLGIYSSPGAKTCAGFEGSLNHEEQDAKSYAAWGIDYLKYDLCSFNDVMKKAPSPEVSHQLMVDAYMKMHKALVATGRPIIYSLCQYGDDNVWEWGPSVGANLWRTTDDITDNYQRMAQLGFGQAGLAKYAGPGHWNDPDMLEVGNGKMNAEEYRTHMSLWAILAAPLLAGNDLSAMTPETLAILTNRDVIAIDQDPLGKQGERIYTDGPIEVWARDLKDGSKAVAIFSRHHHHVTAHIDLRKLGYTKPVHVRDVWQGKDLPSFGPTANIDMAPHTVILLRVAR